MYCQVRPRSSLEGIVERSPKRDSSPPPNAAPPARPLGEVLEFMQALWAVAHGLESTSKRMQETLGVTGPQRLVLRLIGHFEQTSPGELAALLHVHPSSLTGVLRRLESGNFVKRKRDPKDGRRAILTLSPLGQRLNARDAGTVEEAVRRVLATAGADRIAAARELLQALSQELGVAPRS